MGLASRGGLVAVRVVGRRPRSAHKLQPRHDVQLAKQTCGRTSQNLGASQLL